MVVNTEVMNEIETLLLDYGGPMGSFVLKKVIKDMDEARDRFPLGRVSELIDRTVENAIFDPERQREAIRTLRRRVKTSG